MRQLWVEGFFLPRASTGSRLHTSQTEIFQAVCVKCEVATPGPFEIPRRARHPTGQSVRSLHLRCGASSDHSCKLPSDHHPFPLARSKALDLSGRNTKLGDLFANWKMGTGSLRSSWSNPAKRLNIFWPMPSMTRRLVKCMPSLSSRVPDSTVFSQCYREKTRKGAVVCADRNVHAPFNPKSAVHFAAVYTDSCRLTG